MKKTTLIGAMLIAAIATRAQTAANQFCGYFHNDEYNVYIRIDLAGDGIVVPNHEIFGNLPGYLGKQRNSFYWLVTSAKVVGNGKAELELINDYGSEDLKATLTANSDSTLLLTQESGSTIKVPNNGKLLKLPKRLELKKGK